jgi:hypothetical protein
MWLIRKPAYQNASGQCHLEQLNRLCVVYKYFMAKRTQWAQVGEESVFSNIDAVGWLQNLFPDIRPWADQKADLQMNG